MTTTPSCRPTLASLLSTPGREALPWLPAHNVYLRWCLNCLSAVPPSTPTLVAIAWMVNQAMLQTRVPRARIQQAFLAKAKAGLQAQGSLDNVRLADQFRSAVRTARRVLPPEHTTHTATRQDWQSCQQSVVHLVSFCEVVRFFRPKLTACENRAAPHLNVPGHAEPDAVQLVLAATQVAADRLLAYLGCSSVDCETVPQLTPTDHKLHDVVRQTASDLVTRRTTTGCLTQDDIRSAYDRFRQELPGSKLTREQFAILVNHSADTGGQT